MAFAIRLARSLGRNFVLRCLAVNQYVAGTSNARSFGPFRGFSCASTPSGIPQLRQPICRDGHLSHKPLSLPFRRNFHVTAAVLADLPMSKEFVEERVMLVLKLYDKVDHAKLHMDANFQKDLGLDSLDHVEIVFAMEEEFYFEIPDVDAERMHTPRDIAQYVCDKEEIYN